MRRSLLPLALVTLMCGAAPGAPAAEPANMAVGVLQAPRDAGFLGEFLQSELVLREAVAKISAEAAKAPNVSDVARVETPLMGGNKITVQSAREDVPADKLLAALVDVVNDRLREVAKRKHEAAEKHLHEEVRKVDLLQAGLQRAHADLLNLATIHKSEIDPEVAAQRRLRIETELQTLDVEAQGLNARRAIIEHQIAETAGQIEKGAGADPDVLRELTKAVEARKRVLHHKVSEMLPGRAKAGAPEEMEAAKYELAQAEVELAKYRREAAEGAGAGRITRLKERLDDTAIEIAELDAKRKALQEQLKHAQVDPQVTTKRIELELLEREYRRQAEELQRQRAEFSPFDPPRVTVIPL